MWGGGGGGGGGLATCDINFTEVRSILMHCQMQTGFLIQVILHLQYATLFYGNEDQSKILAGIKTFADIFVIF